MGNKQTLKSITVGGVRVDLILDSCLGRPLFEVAIDGRGTSGVAWAGADRGEAFEAFARACRDHSEIRLPEGGRP